MNTLKAASVQLFGVNKEAKTMCAEISDLGSAAFVQIYPDACDQGLFLYNPKTGKTTSWAVDVVSRNVDNDIVCWKLNPTAKSVSQFPALLGWNLIIYND